MGATRKSPGMLDNSRPIRVAATSLRQWVSGGATPTVAWIRDGSQSSGFRWQSALSELCEGPIVAPAPATLWRELHHIFFADHGPHSRAAQSWQELLWVASF